MLSVTVSLWFVCEMEERGGSGDRENREREGFRRRQRKGRKVGVLKGWERGGKRYNYATMLNISQSKRAKERKQGKKRRVLGIHTGGGIGRHCPPSINESAY